MKLPATTKHASAVGAIKLRFAKDTGALTYVQKGGNQSAVDRNGTSLDTYVHAIYGLLLQGTAQRVLMIGCGGGTLGKMLSAAGRRVTIVDIDKASFKLAKRYFGLPADIECCVADGLAFMQKTRARFDALVVDAFIGEKIPAHMTGDAFCSAARRCLRRRGSLFINVCLDDKADLAADLIGARLKNRSWTVRLLDQRGSARNALIIAGDVKKLRRPALRHAPEIETARIKSELGGMRFRRLRGAGKP